MIQKIDCNVSGVLKLAVTGAKTQNFISRPFWYLCYFMTNKEKKG